jgi:EAL and modified HD-GYP domain-containing signal transduction protein
MNRPVLSQVLLGYAPLIDRQRDVIATRLTVFPVQPEAGVPVAELLAALAAALPEAGVRLALNVAHEDLLHALLRAQPAASVMIEVPAFIAGDPAQAQAIAELHARGNLLLLAGRPREPLPAAVLACFTHALIDVADDRRAGAAAAPPGVARTLGFVQSGVRSAAQLAVAFERGAVAVLGWPLDDPLPARPGKGGVRADLQTVVELIRRVDREEPVERLDAVIRLDPTLGFKLLRYINSAAFGLRVEVASFRHAIMLLGYQRLKRWLALLLAQANREPEARPLMYAALRRGLLMEGLVGSAGQGAARAGGDGGGLSGDEAFICGVFSLLDRLMGQPFAELLEAVPVPAGVSRTLGHGDGPYQPYLELVQAVENASAYDLREAAERLLLVPAEVNAALLRALAVARELA